jgi:hypothetical protein
MHKHNSQLNTTERPPRRPSEQWKPQGCTLGNEMHYTYLQEQLREEVCSANKVDNGSSREARKRWN